MKVFFSHACLQKLTAPSCLLICFRNRNKSMISFLYRLSCAIQSSPRWALGRQKFDMKRTLTLVTITVLYWSTFAFAQAPSSTDKKPEQATLRMDPYEITTDTQGVDFGPYMQRVVRDVTQNWNNLIPLAAVPPLLKKGKVCIEFAITKNGQIAGLRYVSGSGDLAFDRAAYGGIAASSPFQPLPTGFYGQYLGLRFTFFYNPLSGISPSHVQVPAGSSVQFSPIMGRNSGPADSVIAWSVGGRGCHGLKCGTISQDGLYTAPPKVPKNPTITVKAKTVKAKGTTDADETASAVVTILPALLRSNAR